MSFQRQPRLQARDEPFLLVRHLAVQCSSGVRTTSPPGDWHRLVAADAGVMIVRTGQGSWSAPASSAVWVPARHAHELEVCRATSLRMLYVRRTRAAWAAACPPDCRVLLVSPLLRELTACITALPALDRRDSAHFALATLLVHEVAHAAAEPAELVWPTDPRAARIASLLQARPDDQRCLVDLCRGLGVSARTAQRLFPEQTGRTFERWRAHLRFLHSVRLLSEGLKVADVAHRCGYRSPSAFVAAFRRAAGTTPARYARGPHLAEAPPVTSPPRQRGTTFTPDS